MSDIYYPAVEEPGGGALLGDEGGNPANYKIVGTRITVFVYWRAIFRDILPPGGSIGTTLVVDNPCTEAFMYQINGPIVKYQGVGDKHAKKYDHLAVHSKLADLHDT